MRFSICFFILFLVFYSEGSAQKTGEVVDEYENVPVYFNSDDYKTSHGKSFSDDGKVYFGQKWQCVEFIKRFYWVKFRHIFPDGTGHASSFVNFIYNQGQLNKERGLIQFWNDGNEKPRKNDILVFPFSNYGHIAIICEVGEDFVEVIQQNIKGKTRMRYQLKQISKNWSIIGEGDVKPLGWLRKG